MESETETENMIVFERCGDYLVYLQKLPDTITNENRESLKDVSKEEKLHASYHANKLLVLKIEHLWEKEKDDKNLIPILINEIKSTNFSEKRLTYKVGEIIEELEFEFDENLENTYSQGIHYYLDKDIARFYMDSSLITEEKFSGELINYYENGNPWKKFTYIQGKKEGECKVWYEDGNLKTKCTYIQGKKEGECKGWFENGNIYEKGTYTQGKENGKYEYWYKNGNLRVKCNYIQGMPDGKHENWYANGNLMIKCNYIQGKLDGKYERWDKNGNIYEDITYSKGKKII